MSLPQGRADAWIHAYPPWLKQMGRRPFGYAPLDYARGEQGGQAPALRTVARREEKDGCVYEVAVEQAERYLREMVEG
jgi:hypothetical protein